MYSHLYMHDIVSVNNLASVNISSSALTLSLAEAHFCTRLETIEMQILISKRNGAVYIPTCVH